MAASEGWGALRGLPGLGPARRGPAAGWEDVGGAPILRKGGEPGRREEGRGSWGRGGGRKERKRGREREGRSRCGKAEEEGGREGARKLGELSIPDQGQEPKTPLLTGLSIWPLVPDGIPVRAVSSLQLPSPRPSPRFTSALQRSPGAAAGEPATAGTYGEQGYLVRGASQRGPGRILRGEAGN